MTVKAIPEGCHSVSPYLSIAGAAEAMAFYKQAFGATELFHLPTPSGEIGHAEIKIGDSSIMLADCCDELPAFRDPKTLGGSSIAIHVYVEDVDKLFEQATAVGAKVIKPLQDQFYGDRNCILEDPFGHVWFLSTHKEDLTSEEIKQRAEEFFAGE